MEWDLLRGYNSGGEAFWGGETVPNIESQHGVIDVEDRGVGVPILCIHGSFSSAAAWRPLQKVLSPRFRVIAPSLWGCGGTSDWPPTSEPTIFRQAELIKQAIDYVGQPVHVVGHSHGGIVALAAALAWPSMLKSLTLLDGLPANVLREANETEALAALHKLHEEYVQAFEGGEALAARRVIDFWTGNGTFSGLPEKFKRHIVDTTPLNMMDWQANWAFAPTADELRALAVPALIVWGAAGNWVASRLALALHSLIPTSAYVELEKASHMMISTHPEQIGRLIAHHVESNMGPKA